MRHDRWGGKPGVSRRFNVGVSPEAELRRDTPCRWATVAPPTVAPNRLHCQATYREDFTTVALETAAMVLPITATTVSGCVDAVEDGRTG